MKILAIISSLLFLTLTILPCSDGMANGSESSTEHSENHDHSEDKGDLCSPFCACACCGISYTLPFGDNLLGYKIAPQSTYIAPYSFNYTHQHSESIWHPPSQV